MLNMDLIHEPMWRNAIMDSIRENPNIDPFDITDNHDCWEELVLILLNKTTSSRQLDYILPKLINPLVMEFLDPTTHNDIKQQINPMLYMFCHYYDMSTDELIEEIERNIIFKNWFYDFDTLTEDNLIYPYLAEQLICGRVYQIKCSLQKKYPVMLFKGSVLFHE